MSYYHSTTPQADEWPSPDKQVAEWMDLLREDEEVSQGYAVPSDDSMEVCW